MIKKNLIMSGIVEKSILLEILLFIKATNIKPNGGILTLNQMSLIHGEFKLVYLKYITTKLPIIKETLFHMKVKFMKPFGMFKDKIHLMNGLLN